MNLLLACATEIEAAPLRGRINLLDGIELVITGVGLVEACAVLAERIASAPPPDLMIGLGVGGGFGHSGVGLLDICLAESEIIADLGVPSGNRVLPFRGMTAPPPVEFGADRTLLASFNTLLRGLDITPRVGPFVSVNAVTASDKRMEGLFAQYQPVCENMEGAALARVAQGALIPWLEVRCISNLVGRRERGKWQIDAASARLAEVAAPCLAKMVQL